MWKPLRLMALTSAVALLGAGCDDDPTGPPRLTGAEVAGNYAVCTLVFDPGGVLASVDIRARAFEPGAAGTALRPPQLAIDNTGEVRLTFVPRGRNIERFITGNITAFGIDAVALQFDPASEVAPQSLLLPQQLQLDFLRTPPTLRVVQSAPYNVSRDAYADLAGLDAQARAQLADPLSGTLTASFQEGGCT